MANFKIEVDAKKLAEEFGDLKDKVEKGITKGVQALAAATHAKAMEYANELLPTTSKNYKEALSFNQVTNNIWVVSLDMKKAGWQESGRKSGWMAELLTGKSSKINKDGKRYAIIPFEHSKKPSEQTIFAQNATSVIKTFLKSQNVPYKKIEYNVDGSPKLGKLHSFKDKLSVGKPSENAKHDMFSGLTIYQSIDKKTNKVRRDVMTFRVITEDMKKDGRWNHPGREGVNIIDRCFSWAEVEWHQTILPSIFDSINKPS